MFLMDVNVLVYAHREDVENHISYRRWLESILNGGVNFAFSDLVLSGFLRVVTHPRIFESPSRLELAVKFCEQIRNAETGVRLTPGRNHWAIFQACMDSIKAQGNDIADAYHAALAIEWNCLWVTTDKGFKRFKNLRCRHPLDLAADSKNGS